ncbi:hypothetical protein [Staphylospora marina]|uniref:hypothetical protein n=1 Tax=Staphylospora marina TaxID=2490858 RepID=UPI0019D31B93|nr:hypothetical protein [Staphylospora marina]
MIPSFKEMTGMTYEELRQRRFKPILKYLRHSRIHPAAVWRLRKDELAEALFYSIQEWRKDQEEEKQWQDAGEKSNTEAIRRNYLRAIEWLAKEGGVSEEFIPVLRRAWKAVKLAKSFDGSRIFEVEGSKKGSVFNDTGLKESLKRRGKTMTDFK